MSSFKTNPTYGHGHSLTIQSGERSESAEHTHGGNIMGNKDAMNYLTALMNREISTRDGEGLTARDCLDVLNVLNSAHRVKYV